MDEKNPQQATTQLEVPQFNIPPQPPPEQPIQQLTEPEPEKKKSWKIWLIILAVIIIAAGLGFYFLSP